MNAGVMPLVQIRTPTYRRPVELRRCLESLQAQTWANWVCDIYDDDPKGSGAAVCDALADPRIIYNRNSAQRFASGNIDQCFSRANPRGADYFCVVEDDNFILDTFIAENVALCRSEGVEIVLRNQLIEYESGTSSAHLSRGGVLDALFTEGPYDPATFQLSVLMGIGVSNGGLFWSRESVSPLEIGFPCTATLQEYLRTLSVREPIYVAMKPLAVWADNAAQTTRNAGLEASVIRRELDLKRSIQELRRTVWNAASPEARDAYLTDVRFAAPLPVRAEGLARSLIARGYGTGLRPAARARLFARGVAVAALGRRWPEMDAFLTSRLAAPH